MTLNKQKILSELGSVVNQLQSADCGCMGKLFGNSNQNNSPMATPYSQHGGCGHSCCHSHGCGYGYNGAARGEPYSMDTQQAYSCMGHCNPPKLYADTYNFLNEKLMQPVVQEVYHDLKTINPTNTIMNNDMARKLGFGQTQQGMAAQNQPQPTNKSYANGLNTFSQNSQMQNQQMMQNSQMMPNSQMTPNSQMMPNSQMAGGMGPQIMNMINGDSIVNSSQPQGRQLTEPMLIDAPQSPHGKVAVTPLSVPMNTNQSAYNTNNPSQLYSMPNAINSMPTTQLPNPAVNSMPTQRQNTVHQPQMPQQNQNYGQHTQGITKFNEMFPGVMQGGDLGFDPMTIAIQMNPENHQRVAMNKIHNMMNNNENMGNVFERPANLATAPGQNTLVPQNALVPNQLQSVPTTQTYNDNLATHRTQLNNQENMIAQNQPVDQTATPYSQQPSTQIPLQNQQVYQVSPNPHMVQQPIASAQAGANPNAGAPIAQSNLATVRENIVLSQPGSQLLPQNPIKEPIFPVDTTKQKIYHNLNHRTHNYQDTAYNTLGQPVEKLPGNLYQNVVPPLPQTLSPQPIQNNQAKYSTVKATVSKTSIMGNRPVGLTPSRTQLQQIYNQYKGSQSFTQQNVKPPVEGDTHSERKLNVAKEMKLQNAIPVEKTGGDSYGNSQLNEQAMNPAHPNGQIGDVPQEVKPDAMKPEKDMSPTNNRKSRNGLQDLVYTSYPTSAAWSFHGDNYRSQLAARRYSRYR